MSAIGLDMAEQSAMNSVNIEPLDYFKEVLSNRAHHVFEAPKLVAEIFVRGFRVANATLGAAFSALSKVANTENLVFFAQDVVAFPEQTKTFYEKTIAWWNGSTSLLNFAHAGRKFVAHVGSTVGDYVGGCSVLSDLGVDVSRINKISDKIGNIGSAFGAASRITDYVLDDTQSKPAHALTPQLLNIREPIAQSRDLWNLARDVSILSLSVLCIACGGFASIPVSLSIVLPGAILGSRMAAYYKELQLKAVDSSYTQMQAAKQVLKG